MFRKILPPIASAASNQIKFETFTDLDAANQRVAEFVSRYPQTAEHIESLKEKILAEPQSQKYNNPKERADFIVADLLQLSREETLDDGEKMCFGSISRSRAYCLEDPFIKSESRPLISSIKSALESDSGNCKLLKILGKCHSAGIGVEKNLTESFRLNKLAADQGDVVAQTRVAADYLNGRGVEKDIKEAVKFFTLASDRGYSVGQANLAYLHYFGKGVEQNYEESRRLYKLTADKGDGMSLVNLASIYATGKGGAENRTQSYLYDARAVNSGFDDRVDPGMSRLYELVAWVNPLAKVSEFAHNFRSEERRDNLGMSITAGGTPLKKSEIIEIIDAMIVVDEVVKNRRSGLMPEAIDNAKDGGQKMLPAPSAGWLWQV